MALINKILPLCDVCGKMWLPDEHLRDGKPNPGFHAPELLKRCGKCKSSKWNKNVAKAEKRRIERETPIRTELLKSRERCRHMVYDCKICHPEAA